MMPASDSTTKYRDANLAAANLGDDADTTAAVCGRVAGAFYGGQAIPARWLKRLAMREDTASLADPMYPKAHAMAVSR